MTLVVREKRALTPDVVRLRLGRGDGSELPAFEAGAHLELHIAGTTRHYSITSLPGERSHYEIAVLRAVPSRGGSAFIHDTLAVGDAVEADGPHNTFGFVHRPPYAVFIAGGIGLTPFFTMIHACLASSVPYELHYVTRTAADRLPIGALGSSHLFTYVSRERSEASRPLHIPGLLQRVRRDAHIYVCGPRGMIDAVRAAASGLGWPGAAVHSESFGAPLRSTDRPILVRLSLSGVTLRVEPGDSILQAMLDHGIWANYACQRGECGSCYVEVTGGVADHRDTCLSAGQRRAGMCPCVSWSATDTLTIRA
ncbi:MAG: 2Fe-2S iron-sulfur cluster-binding protein [Vicinamibacterales bacterium]